MDPFDAAVATAFHTPSMQGIEDTFVQNVRTHLNKFLELWRQFGLEEDRMSSRLDELWGHFRTLLGQMYEEDFASYQKVVKRIKARTEAVEGLASLLQVAVKSVRGPLFQKEKVLDEELERLKNLKKERLEAYSRLKGEEQEHRGAMLLEPSEGRVRKVPSEEDVQQLKQRVAKLKEERERRGSLFAKGHKELAAALQSGEWTPQTAFERDLLALEEPPLSAEAVDLLEATLGRARRQTELLKARKKTLIEKLKRLWRTLEVGESERVRFREDYCLQTLTSMELEVERLDEIRRHKMGPLVDGLRQELEELWDKCHVPQSEKHKFRSHSFSEFNGGILELLEDEVEKWRRRHEGVRPILEKIGRRQHLWDEMVALETNAGNPDRFRNRRGNLLAEEKERKRLQKELPSLENNIFKDIEEHELMSGTPFLYYGEDYRSFVSNQWAQRLNQKEFQKLERRKQRSLESTAVSTPSRRLSGTPGATPKKVARSNLGSSAPCTPLASRPPNRANTAIVGRLFSPRSAQKEDREPRPAESLNGTTYTDFVDGLDQSNFHSSAIEKNSKRGKGGKGGKSKKVGILRKSARNTVKAAAKLTPKRGKLGLPFLI